MPQYRLGNDGFLIESGSTWPRHCRKGEVVDLSCAPPISAQPLDQNAIDAFQAHHGNRRIRPNGLQVYDATTDKTQVLAAGGGWRK
jgi:hypothetical protein